MQSLAVSVMRPDDIVEANRLHYAHPSVIGCLSEDKFVDGGLEATEVALLEHVPVRKGRLLDLFAGAGREAFAFARMGFDVTCVDFSADLNAKTREHALRRGLHIAALNQNVSRLDLPPGSFDVAWLNSQMYSSIPGRAARVRMLSRIAAALKPRGYFVCQFRWNARLRRAPLADAVRKAVAVVTFGHVGYQPGDILMGNSEFMHAFSSEDEFRTEFTRGGFDVLHFRVEEQRLCGSTVLRKS